MSRIVVFTDLDGTLLNHEDYSIRRALPSLDLLIRRGADIVPVSSKTADEIRYWMKLLVLKGPFVAENGGRIHIPRGFFREHAEGTVEDGGELNITLGVDISEVRNALGKISGETGIALKGFGDMSEEEISSLTGLKGAELRMSMTRAFDEPFIANGSDVEGILREEVEKRNLMLFRGGRFYHLAGGCDKGKAVSILVDLFKREAGEVISVGIGDSENDLSFLRVVDFPFLVQKPGGFFDPAVAEGDAKRIPGVGPHGWRIAVEEVLSIVKA